MEYLTSYFHLSPFAFLTPPQPSPQERERFFRLSPFTFHPFTLSPPSAASLQTCGFFFCSLKLHFFQAQVSAIAQTCASKVSAALPLTPNS